jgi:hypothetical protein
MSLAGITHFRTDELVLHQESLKSVKPTYLAIPVRGIKHRSPRLIPGQKVGRIKRSRIMMDS